jgi:hypothetical protein
VLQLLALRYLGVEGLGAYTLMFGVIVVATAIASGLVGDSLTVLDRSNPSIRSGLQAWLALTAIGIAFTLALGGEVFDWLTSPQAIALGICTAVFLIEDTLRRMLMAAMKFWSLVLVDLTGLVLAVGMVLAVQATAASGSTLTTFIAALAVGQTGASLVALFHLPPSERWIARGVRPDLATVWGYGSWRAFQQVLRPATFTGVRVIVTVAVSLAAFGELEAARLYVAPTLLAVLGVSSYLFASYARDRTTSIRSLRRRADRTVLRLAVATMGLGVVATVLVPYVGGLFANDGEVLDKRAVLGWAAYAAATAAVTPYGSLAAVRGQQAGVLGIRVCESLVSITVVLVLVVLDGSVFLVPFVLAIGSAVSGFAMRRLLVDETPQPPTSAPSDLSPMIEPD